VHLDNAGRAMSPTARSAWPILQLVSTPVDRCERNQLIAIVW
jgi:hypothetical protein